MNQVDWNYPQISKLFIWVCDGEKGDDDMKGAEWVPSGSPE